MKPCQIAPSILSFDMTDLRPSVLRLEAAGADWIHLDVMDGQFVPPITFGAAYVKRLRAAVQTPFEAHLMTLTPEQHFDAFIEAGCERVIYHVEATHHAHRLAQELRRRGISPGVAINPATPVEAVIELLPIVDLVLVMTVNPGWGGQDIIRPALDKVRRLRQMAPEISIEVDGGINLETLPEARGAGADMFVVGSHLADAPSLEEAFRELREQCG